MAFPVDESWIKAAEQALGRRLPATLRNRLMRDNGGQIAFGGDDDWSLHPVRDASDRKRLSRTANDIVRENSSARQWRGFPHGAVCVASNGTGDLLVLLPSSDKLYVWDHETDQLQALAVDWS